MDRLKKIKAWGADHWVDVQQFVAFGSLAMLTAALVIVDQRRRESKAYYRGVDEGYRRSEGIIEDLVWKVEDSANKQEE